MMNSIFEECFYEWSDNFHPQNYAFDAIFKIYGFSMDDRVW